MTPSLRAVWQRALVAAIVCVVAIVIIFLARWIVHVQEESATLAAAQRLVMILEDHRQRYGRFPGSLTNLFTDSAGSSNRRAPAVLGRFDYRSDGQSYELKFEAGGPVVLNRTAIASDQIPGR